MVQGKTVPSMSKTSEMPTKVLIIPEEKDLAELVRMILNWHRNAIVTISVERLRPRGDLTIVLAVAERDPPDLIILPTLNSPLMFSDEACHRFRASRANSAVQDIPILFIGHWGKNPDKEARRFGANGYVAIPLDWELLLAAYDAVLGGETFYPLLHRES